MRKAVIVEIADEQTDNVDIPGDFEDWEGDANFFYSQDWEGLLRVRKQVAKQNPNSFYDQWRLGEAYVLNQEYEKGILFLKDLHQKYPEAQDVQYSLLTALWGSGREETDFDWIIKPSVLKLDEETLDYCYGYLKPKRKPRSITDLYCECMGRGFPKFNEEQLMMFLQTDNRFVFFGDKNRFYDCDVAVISA